MASTAGTSFVYDGEGRRVQKTAASGVVTTYVHDAMGNLAAEYSTAADSVSGTQYMSADFLGSTRLITDSSGNPTRCFDYLPFGEEIGADVNGRSGCYEQMGSPQYPTSPDVVNQKFTGKERDAETGLDYFGARYFSGAQGRWTSPDWSAKPAPVPYARLGNPQSLNLYSYGYNNPLRVVDIDGHDACKDNPALCRAIRDAVSSGGSIQQGWAAYAQAAAAHSSQSQGTTPFVYSTARFNNVQKPPQDEPVPDVAIDHPQVVQQVGQNMRGFNGLMLAFAGGSAAAGVVMGALPALAPETLYHFTSQAGYEGIVEAGQIAPGNGITGWGVYGTALPNASTVSWAGVPTDAMVSFSPGLSEVTPGLVPGLWWSAQPAITTLFQYGIPGIF